MDLKLNEKVVLVTGSAKGIGRAIAEAFHRENCMVAINSRNASELQTMQESLGDRISFHVADVTNENECKELVSSVLAQWGRLDILVCNVGSGASVPPGYENRQEWEKVFNTNFYSATNMIECAQDHLMQSQGVILCISSICGVTTLNAPVTYSVAKSALNMYVRTSARHLAEKNIRINAIAPGNILSPDGVWEKKMKDDKSGVEKMLNERVAQKRLGKPGEIAEMAVFLCSPHAGFCTGSIYLADGGQVC